MLRKHWRWWLAAAAASAFVVRRRLRRHTSPGETVPQESVERRPALAAADATGIFALARRLALTRAAQTDVERNACLLRAAEILLESKTAAGVFVASHSDAFLRACKEEGRAQAVPGCAHCGGPMYEASSQDDALGESMPVWQCRRCGAQVPR
jgi:hypothetical protein